MLKLVLAAGMAVLPIASIIGCISSAGAETLITKSFKVDIISRCEEGNVTCDRVTYIGKSLKTGKSITLTGKTLNNSYTYTFLGYEFRNGVYSYIVTKDNVLLVYKGDRIILREQGTSVNN